MTSFTERIKELLYPVPAELRRNHRSGDLDAVRASIGQNYHRGWRARERNEPHEYEKDLADHTDQRLAFDRSVFVPWLNSVRALHGLNVLEIGCGTGSSSVALAEQGAQVVGIDIDTDALAVARDRCRSYDLECEFAAENAMDYVPDRDFDLVIFFACLEHMTIDERLASLSNLWGRLKPGALLAVVETPNRLWHTDLHTSLLPFFNWLPDDLAFLYSGRSDRLRRWIGPELTEEALLHFRRLGRGVSFHEFDLAIGDARSLYVVSSLLERMRFHVIGRPKDWIHKALLRRLCPGLHSGWFDRNLDLVIQPYEFLESEIRKGVCSPEVKLFVRQREQLPSCFPA